MPLVLQEALDPPGEWGTWSITESEAALLREVRLFPEEAAQFAAIRGAGRRREFLAARLLLHRMSGRGERGELFKDEHGKPHLRGSIFHVSISHTHGFSAAIAHPRPCGVDIQAMVPRISRLAHKFVGEAEEAAVSGIYDDIPLLHLIWSAKEAMYKAYGLRQLDFRRDLHVDLTEYPNGTGRLCAHLSTVDTKMNFRLWYRMTPQNVLVGVVSNDPEND